MAKRLLNRKQLRAEAEQANRQVVPTVAGPICPADEEAKASASKTPAKRAPRAPRKPRAPKEPERLRARWGVFDNGMKRVAIFDFNQRAAADQKVADLNARKAGQFFLQIVKEPMTVAVVPPG